MVDATDRERIHDCRQELEGLLLQEVSTCVMDYAAEELEARADGNEASDGSESAGVQEQERCAWMHG